MPSTSLHLPESLLEDLDRMASESGTSRNRLIVQACEEALRRRKQWPAEYLDDSRFSTDELDELRAAAQDFADDIVSSRRNRDSPPF